MGLGKAGFRHVEIVEWDRWCCDTLRENRRIGVSAVRSWPNALPRDIRSVSFRSHEGRIDVISGGPPCQPFSLGGKHGAHADQRDMWPEAVRAVREVKPKAFVFENVKGLKRASFANYFSYILLQLQYPSLAKRVAEAWESHFSRLQRHHTSARNPRLEYRVVAQVLNAADYGVPQKRERVFFVGFRADLGLEWSFPKPTHSLDALLWSQVRSGEYWDRHEVALKARDLDAKYHVRGATLEVHPALKPWATTRDAICDLPDPERNPHKAARFRNHKYQPGARVYPGHTGSPLDEPAKTLKAGVHGVPGGENVLVRPDGSVRYFTVRESARLQTFPDEYELHGSWSEAMRQLGNAVPVDLALVVARSVRERLRINGRGGVAYD